MEVLRVGKQEHKEKELLYLLNNNNTITQPLSQFQPGYSAALGFPSPAVLCALPAAIAPHALQSSHSPRVLYLHWANRAATRPLPARLQ